MPIFQNATYIHHVQKMANATKIAKFNVHSIQDLPLSQILCEQSYCHVSFLITVKTLFLSFPTERKLNQMSTNVHNYKGKSNFLQMETDGK